MVRMSVERYISDDIQFDTRDEAVKELDQMASEFGAKYLAFGILKAGQQNTDLAFDAISTYSEEWKERYYRREYHLLDPILKKVATARKPFDWRSTHTNSKLVRQFFGDSVEHGLGKHGFTIPIHGPQGELCALSFNADVKDSDWPKMRDEVLPHVMLFAHQFSDEARKVARPEICKHALSPRESEVLKWAAEGKSVWETAQILSISYHSVKSYLQNAQQKLQCSNKLHTVVTALKHSLI